MDSSVHSVKPYGSLVNSPAVSHLKGMQMKSSEEALAFANSTPELKAAYLAYLKALAAKGKK